MPEWNETKASELARRQDLTTAAFHIERDFRGLVETLKRTIEMVDSSEQEILESLANTKAVAQRGLRLSKLLLRTARRRRL